MKRLECRENSIPYTEIIKIDFFHLRYFFYFIGEVWSEFEYDKALLQEVDISLDCRLRNTKNSSETMV